GDGDRAAAGPAQDGLDRHPLLPAARPRGPDPRHLVRRGQAAEISAARLRRGPAAPAPPLREHRLLAAPRRRFHLALVRDAGRHGPRPPLHPPPPARRMASVANSRRLRLRAGCPGRLRVHGLPARDRQACESDDQAARRAGSRRQAQVGVVQSPRFLLVSSGLALLQTWYAPARWSPRAAHLLSTPKLEVSWSECFSPRWRSAC